MEYLKTLPSKLKLFEDFLGDKPFSAGQKVTYVPLRWRHNGHVGVSNHQLHDCLHNCSFRRRSKKTSKFRVNGLCIHRWPVNSPHKWPVTWKMFPFDDFIMLQWLYMRVIKSQPRQMFGQHFAQSNDKQEKCEIHCTGPLWGRSTGDHWIRIPKNSRCSYDYDVCLLTVFTLIHLLAHC